MASTMRIPTQLKTNVERFATVFHGYISKIATPGYFAAEPKRSARGGNGGEEAAQSFRHRGVGEDRVPQDCIGEAPEHRRLHGGHDFPRLGSDHREAENTVARPLDEHLHE